MSIALRPLEILLQPQSIAAILLCLVLLAVIHRYLSSWSSGLPLPPGPPIDNLFLGNSIPTALYGTFTHLLMLL